MYVCVCMTWLAILKQTIVDLSLWLNCGCSNSVFKVQQDTSLHVVNQYLFDRAK